MKWKRYDQAVEMIEQRFRFFPQRFQWGGRYYEVDSVEKTWSMLAGRRQKQGPRRYFRVRCASTVFELYQDLIVGTWHVRRAALTTGSVYPVPRMVPVWQE